MAGLNERHVFVEKTAAGVERQTQHNYSKPSL